MKINNILYNIIVEEENILKTTKTKPIVNAIKNRNPITFYYSGPRKPKKDSVRPGNRVEAEAVALGLSKKGNLIVRAFVKPPSVSKKGFEKQSELINQINTPTLIIWGDQDQLIPVENAYEFQQNIKGSKLSILHNIGHVPMEETPTAFTEIVKGFIK